MREYFLILSLALFVSESAEAFRNNASYVGLGFYSQNALSKVSNKDDGSASFLGSSSYPLLLKHDRSIFGDWFFTPQLTYTLMPRSSAADSAKTTILHLMLPFGKNGGGALAGWDWSVGPGIIRYEIKGAGGTTELNNGTGTASFALPGRTATVQNVTVNAGFGFGFSSSRVALDLIVENIGSNGKRAESFLLSYGYNWL